MRTPKHPSTDTRFSLTHIRHEPRGCRAPQASPTLAPRARCHPTTNRFAPQPMGLAPRDLPNALRSTDPPLPGVEPRRFDGGWALCLWTTLSAVAHRAVPVRAMRAPSGCLSMTMRRGAFPIAVAGAIVAGLTVAFAPLASAAPIGAAAPSSALTYTDAPTERETALAARHGGGDVLVRRRAPLTQADGRTSGQRTDHTIYTVKYGDTLRSIAARFLGDERRWPELFAANRGSAGLADGRTLIDPDLIWPGLKIIIPVPPSPPPAPTEIAPTGTASPATTPMPATAAVPASAAPAPPDPASVGARPTASGSPGRAPLVYSAGVLGLAALGGALFLSRRRTRDAALPAVVGGQPPLAQGPDDFAESDLLETFAHRAHGGAVEPAVAIAHHAARFIAERGVAAATPLLIATQEGTR